MMAGLIADLAHIDLKRPRVPRVSGASPWRPNSESNRDSGRRLGQRHPSLQTFSNGLGCKTQDCAGDVSCSGPLLLCSPSSVRASQALSLTFCIFKLDWNFPPMIAYRSKWVCGYFSVALAILIISMPGSAARAQQSLASTPSPAVSGVDRGNNARRSAEQPAPPRVDDKNRSYTKEELIATIPADDQHKSPLRPDRVASVARFEFPRDSPSGRSRPRSIGAMEEGRRQQLSVT